jgi:phosphoesterase RecJ-like protein
MDEVEDSMFKDALGIVVDVSQTHRVDDDRVFNTPKKIVIDHHQNPSDFADLFYHQPDKIAAAEVITMMAIELGLAFSARSAHALMLGILSDSGRFLYKGVNASTFEAASHLMKTGLDLNGIYESMYTYSLNYKRIRGYALGQFEVLDTGVAFLKNKKTIKKEYDVSEFTVSRGLVNVMGQLEGVEIWVNFTETDADEILAELRSRELPVNDVASKYGGGGHLLAAGCTLASWDACDQLIKDLERKLT